MNNTLLFNPVIKWTGSKRHQASEIISLFPREIDTYFEPFVGGGSVLGALLLSDISVKRFVCSDINSDLISVWNAIKGNPGGISEHYRKLWEQLKSKNTRPEKKAFYSKIRERYNRHHNPFDFLFLTRTCYTGLIRYNKSGKFNSSLHPGRDGINPQGFSDVIWAWSNELSKNDVEFIHRDYKEVHTEPGDFLYLDPPYNATPKGMYRDGIALDELWSWMSAQAGGYILSFDGITRNEISVVKDYTFSVPSYLFSEHRYIKSGTSSFRRIRRIKDTSTVYESVYIK